MTYASDDRTVVERIWNSRDGVTPFVVLAKDGETELTHVDWEDDEYLPDFSPPPGSRVFVDLTTEAGEARAWERTRTFFADPIDAALARGRGMTPEKLLLQNLTDARRRVAEGWPMLVVVGEEEPPPEEPLFRDGVILALNLSWAWWERPWKAFLLLCGMEVSVRAKVPTQNLVGVAGPAEIWTNDYLPWWPTSPVQLTAGEESIDD